MSSRAGTTPVLLLSEHRALARYGRSQRGVAREQARVSGREAAGVDGAQGAGWVRLHRTVLYSSIYRANDQLLVDTRIYSFTAALADIGRLTE